MSIACLSASLGRQSHQKSMLFFVSTFLFHTSNLVYHSFLQRWLEQWRRPRDPLIPHFSLLPHQSSLLPPYSLHIFPRTPYYFLLIPHWLFLTPHFIHLTPHSSLFSPPSSLFTSSSTSTITWSSYVFNLHCTIFHNLLQLTLEKYVDSVELYLHSVPSVLAIDFMFFDIK